MRLLLSLPHPDLHWLARLRAWHSLFAACLIGGAVALFTASRLWETWLLVSCLVCLIIAGRGAGRLDAAQTRLRASSLDPDRPHAIP